MIAANAGNDAGAIATWSSVGGLYGFQMLWVLVVITVALSVIQEMCARMGVATGQGLSDLIRERFGVRGAAFAMCTLLIANTLITISEFAGIAAAGELIGISKYIAVPIAAVAVWLLITRGSYARVQTIFLVMSLAFFTYPIAAVLAHPDWGQVLHHTVVPSVHITSIYLQLLVGTVGTTITPYMQFFIQASVAEKGVNMEHYAGERGETYFGSIFAAAIVASIVIATGATGLRRQPWSRGRDQYRGTGGAGAHAVPWHLCAHPLRGWALRGVAAGRGGAAALDGVFHLRVLWLRARRLVLLP